MLTKKLYNEKISKYDQKTEMLRDSLKIKDFLGDFKIIESLKRNVKTKEHFINFNADKAFV